MDEKALLQRMMVNSLNTLYDKDQYLIWNHKRNVENHVSERGLMFRFGIYFDMLARVQFPEYHVDSEYNRNLADLKMLPSWERGCYPDLILHKRGKNTKNLLVIEAKTWWNSDQTEDRLKIEQFCALDGKYHYKYGALIYIGKTRRDARIRFCTGDVEEVLCLDTPKLTTKRLFSNFSKNN